MKKEFLIEILVGTIILGTLAYLAMNVVDMKGSMGAITGTLGTVDTKVTTTSERVDRIAQVLPDIGVRVAKEEVTQTIRTAIVSTTPTQAADGKWQMAVHVIDADTGKKWTIPISLSSKDDRQAVYAVIGAVADTEPRYCSLSQMASWSGHAEKPIAIPRYVDARASFVLRTTDAGQYLKTISWMGSAPKESTLEKPVDTWDALIAALKDKPKEFQPK